MIIKIVKRLQNICIAAKISILVSATVSIALFAFAIILSRLGGGIDTKYLYEHMACVATDIFAIGVFWGLAGDFLAIIIDRRGK